MTTFESLRQLVAVFQRDIELAKDLKSANPEDDLAIKSAIVGFSYNSPTQDWAKGHYDLVTSRFAREYNNESLAEYGEHAENIKLFHALAIGFLLGLYQQGHITDDEFKTAEQQLPGLIMFYLPELTARPAGQNRFNDEA